MTTVLGVNQNYGKERYYKNILSKDEVRVNKRFEEAAGRGVCIRKGVLRTEELIAHLASHGPIILLTNSELLCCDVCSGQKKLSNELRWEFIIGHSIGRIN